MSAQPGKESAALVFLYRTVPGRMLLKLLICRGLSQAAGRVLSSPVSRPLISPFIRKNGIDLTDYAEEDYSCFNDFFCRRIRPERRPLPADPAELMAPCDGLLSAYRITDGMVLPIKQSRYTVAELLGGDPAAEKFLIVSGEDSTHFPNSALKKSRSTMPVALETLSIRTSAYLSAFRIPS